jgi:hypothetical protein
MRKNTFILYLAAMLSVVLISGCVQEEALGVTRSLSSQSVSPGGALTVTLSVNVGDADNYAIDDTYPPGWHLTDAGTGAADEQGHWKQVVIDNAQNARFTYTLRAPSEKGTYTFSGIYMLDGMSAEAAIMDQDTVVVG